MTKVPTTLGRAAKVDRLVMVGLRRIAVRELNFLAESRKNVTIVCARTRNDYPLWILLR